MIRAASRVPISAPAARFLAACNGSPCRADPDRSSARNRQCWGIRAARRRPWPSSICGTRYCERLQRRATRASEPRGWRTRAPTIRPNGARHWRRRKAARDRHRHRASSTGRAGATGWSSPNSSRGRPSAARHWPGRSSHSATICACASRMILGPNASGIG